MPIQIPTYAVPRADLGEAFREFDLTGFVAMDVLPAYSVQKKAATMSVLTRENLKDVNDSHANGAAFERVNLNMEDLAYACVGYGLENLLTDEDRANYANDFDAERESVDNIIRKLLVRRERRAAAALFNTSTWTGAALTTDVTDWDTITTTIIAHVIDAKEKVRQNTGAPADSLLIGAGALPYLLKNTQIIARCGTSGVVSEQTLRANLAAIFGLQNLFVGGAVYDSANEGIAFSGSDIWSDNYALVFRRQTGGLTNPGLGRHIIWSPLGSEQPVVEQYREEQRKADVFRVEMYEQAKVFDPYYGHLLAIDT